MSPMIFSLIIYPDITFLIFSTGDSGKFDVWPGLGSAPTGNYQTLSVPGNLKNNSTDVTAA